MNLFLLLLGCQTEEKTGSADSGGPEDLVSSCDIPLPALPWGEGAPIESLEGVAEELEALDLTQLPDPVDVSDLIPLYLGFVAYALEIPPAEIGSSITHAQAEEAGDLGRVVLGSLLLGKDTELGVDFDFFRRGFHHYYTCSRGFPTTLEQFKAMYGAYDSTTGAVVSSIAKCSDRNLIADTESGVYVAESLAEGAVRETEILLEGRRGDGQLEFLVYDADGMLSTRTQFPTINNGPHLVTSSPYACMSCHFNPDSSERAWGFDILVPSTGPCM